MPKTQLLWCDPRILNPPGRITSVDRARQLAASFREVGWLLAESALVGYWEKGRIQLLNGTHRRAGAMLAKIAVPVLVHEFEAVKEAWDTDKWPEIIESGKRRA